MTGGIEEEMDANDDKPNDGGGDTNDDNDPRLTLIIPPLTPPPPPSPATNHSSSSKLANKAFAPILGMDGTTILITTTHKVLDFISTMLFCIGSAFYMMLSVMDYTWGVNELRSLPPDIYMADDDATLYDYIATNNTDHNYADDYIPNMNMKGAPVSYYQIYYICGGLCFAIAGTIDMITERSLWPIFRFFAGFFAVASAIYITGNDYQLSNIFNLVSVHCYLVDSILLLRYPRCCAVYPTWVEEGDDSGGGKQKYKKRYLLFGDFSYFVGSAIDVVLAILWVFYWASDWNISICVSAVVGSALWLLCSLVYMKAFFKGDFYPNPDPTVLPPVRLSSVILDSVRTKSALFSSSSSSSSSY